MLIIIVKSKTILLIISLKITKNKEILLENNNQLSAKFLKYYKRVLKFGKTSKKDLLEHKTFLKFLRKIA